MDDLIHVDGGKIYGNFIYNKDSHIFGIVKIKFDTKDFDITNAEHHKKIKMKCKGVSSINFLNGDVITFLNGDIHNSNDQPAVIGRNGTCKFWYRYGVIHRGVGFNCYAVMLPCGTLKWYIDGELHNDGPSIIWGYKYHTDPKKRDEFEPFGYEYYWHGKLNNMNGPAIDFENGYKVYAIDGVKNRPSSEGPAVYYPNGDYEYWNDGVLGIVQKMVSPRLIQLQLSPKIKPKTPIISWANGDKWFDDGTAIFSNGDFLDFKRIFHFADENVPDEIRIPILNQNIKKYYQLNK